MFATLSPLSVRAFAASSVLWEISITLEIADHDNPLARYSPTFHQLISLNGRPMCFPFIRTRATPAFVRSLRFSRSRPATHEKIASMRFLIERSVTRPRLLC